MNNVLYLSKVNESYIKLYCEDRGTLKDISEYFTFKVPNYEFNPLYRAKKWDGTIKLYNLVNSQMPYGLLSKLKHFCKTKNINLVFEDDFEQKDKIFDISFEEAEKYIKSLNLSNEKGLPLEIRKYQIESFLTVINNKRILLLSPTSSGKSLILYCIIRYLLEHNSDDFKGLLVVPTISLVTQMYGDFLDYSKLNQWDVKSNLHKIFGGEEKTSNKPISISTWQSLYKEPRNNFNRYNLIIVDEAHLATSKSISHIVYNSINASYRIGTTGTLSEEKVSELFLNGLFGDTIQFVTTKKLMDDNHVSKLKIKCIVLKHESHKHKLKPTHKISYDKEIDYIVSSEARNKFIEDLVFKLKGNTLVLFRYVEKHGKILYDNIKLRDTTKKRKIFLLYGDTPKDERDDIRAIVEKEDDAIIIGSSSLIATGTNIKKLHNVVFGHPFKRKVRNLQSIGRALRLSKSKDMAVIYDIADNLTYNDNKLNYCLEHLQERLKVYRDEKFLVEIFKLNLPTINKEKT